MPDTGRVPRVDLNADLGESDRLTGADLAVLDVVTSANVACGFHAGGPEVMAATAEACVARGVAIGAHVSYRDRAGFGRRPVDVALDRLAADVGEQWEALVAEAARAGLRVVVEGFPDRAYDPDGALADRSRPGAEVDSSDEVAARAACMVLRSGVAAHDGTWVDLAVETLCIHGDHPEAPVRARAVRRALESAGITVAAFDAPDGLPGSETPPRSP